MPGKTILGQPTNEAKWSQAKELATKEGHDGEHDFIMEIYKRLMHLGEYKKSSIDLNSDSLYSKDRKIKLILSKGKSFENFRCKQCNALLFKGQGFEKSFIEIKCRRCGTLNIT